jgi:hypothetical protein
MTTCICCGRPGEAVQGSRFRAECWRKLPKHMRDGYRDGTYGIRQIARASRDGQASIKQFGGGRK